ncbi:MAG: hypothetical protein JSS02_33440 [Planctomycetes bacterium]|nr:hypothetical protein [Planctomycetota bacterium]
MKTDSSLPKFLQRFMSQTPVLCGLVLAASLQMSRPLLADEPAAPIKVSGQAEGACQELAAPTVDARTEKSANPAKQPVAKRTVMPVAATRRFVPQVPASSEGESSATTNVQSAEAFERALQNSHISNLEASMRIRATAIKPDALRRVRIDRLTAQQYFANTSRYVHLGADPLYQNVDVAYAPMYQFQHHPIYFEDPNLERCGHSLGCCTQPLWSGIEFYANVALCPFKMCVTCPCDLVYPQADCTPYTRYSCIDNIWGPYPSR